MEEYWNCRNYTVESKLGEYPGIFLILTILLIISSFLFWVLRCFFNSIEDHRMNINIFLNKRITELLICHIYIWVKDLNVKAKLMTFNSTEQSIYIYFFDFFFLLKCIVRANIYTLLWIAVSFLVLFQFKHQNSFCFWLPIK